MIISPLCDDTIGWNFTYGCPRARYLGIREHFPIFLNFTKLLALQKWIKLALSIPSALVQGLRHPTCDHAPPPAVEKKKNQETVKRKKPLCPLFVTRLFARIWKSLDEATGIKHNMIYSVHCEHISWQKHNGFRSPPSFYERIL